ncbi:hypothetical protein [Xanthocytophaga flavus]|uniref:hypothetical protein n=1 Tax=Xanthocytophaga flava TaxID=3048013 RepID=UPI0028D0D78D|nr:hypothetical protein [Xanthocytophaga flavus]
MAGQTSSKCGCPISNGYIEIRKEPLFYMGQPSRNAMIKSDKDSLVINTHEGHLLVIAEITGLLLVGIKKKEQLFVYSKLKKVFFQKGEFIKKGAVLGIAKKDESTQRYIIAFSVWKDIDKLEPELFINCHKRVVK